MKVEIIVLLTLFLSIITQKCLAITDNSINSIQSRVLSHLGSCAFRFIYSKDSFVDSDDIQVIINHLLAKGRKNKLRI